ncbi:MAG: hypothetical protein M1830_009622 [Pleopsidium flavum]|nr:MAG: hypothetical protein M1830_009622 [Pleopsidium flavum]
MQCGLSLSEGQHKMQEDLATLFSRNLTLANSEHSSSMDSQADVTPHPIAYITQHYHHSAHVVPPTAPAQNSITSSSDADIDQSSPAVILSQNNIDPATLFPSQLTLFQQADADQQLRLLELWSLSPPSYGGHALAEELGNWPPTSLQQEEEMARLRYERKLLDEGKVREESRLNEMEQVCKGSMITLQEGDGRPNAEPYILSGYEILARRDYGSQVQHPQDEIIDHQPPQLSAHAYHYNQATDPVFQGQQWWHNLVGNQAMEHQYGAFDQMNQFRPQPSTFVGTHGPEDEEML